MADFRIQSSWRNHRKRRRLKRKLGADGVLAIEDLWAYAAEERKDGMLDGMTEEDIAEEVEWEGDAEELIEALLDVGLLDKTPDGYALHNWAERQPYVASFERRSEAAKKAAKERWASRGDEIAYDGKTKGMRPACDMDAEGNAESKNGNAPFPLPLPLPLPSPDPFPSPDPNRESNKQEASPPATPKQEVLELKPVTVQENHTREPDPSSVPGMGTLNSRQRKVLNKHLVEARQIWEAQNESRKRVDSKCRTLAPLAGSLMRVADRLEDGATFDECLHVLKVAESEAERSGSVQWHNGVTIWRPDNFSRNLGKEAESGKPLGADDDKWKDQPTGVIDLKKAFGRTSEEPSKEQVIIGLDIDDSWANS